MPFLRLLLAFALTVAIPLQGFAAATCLCKLRQAQHEASSTNASALQQPGISAAQFAEAVSVTQASHQRRDANASHWRAVTHSAGVAPFPVEKKHGSCRTCSMSCCQAAVSPSDVPQAERINAHPDQVAFLPLPFASWTEPVPRKPPRV